MTSSLTSPPPASPRLLSGPHATVGALALIVLACAAAWHNSFSGEFVFDDVASILQNPTIRQAWPIWPALAPPRDGRTVQGRPTLNLSLAINYAIGQTSVTGYHVANLLLHALVALVLFAVVRQTLLCPRLRDRFANSATPLALVITLLWAVHPLQTAAVTYVIQRAEILMALFYLLTLFCLIRGANAKDPGLWYYAAMACCALGTASKESMASAPLVALLYDRLFLTSSFRETFRKRWDLYAALAGSWVLLAFLVGQSGGRAGSAGFHGPIAVHDYALTQIITPW